MIISLQFGELPMLALANLAMEFADRMLSTVDANNKLYLYVAFLYHNVKEYDMLLSSTKLLLQVLNVQKHILM